MKNTCKLMIVDDEPMNLFVFQDILSTYDHYICEYVNSGEKALELCPVFCPDIILLDIMMSGIDGYEVCKKIRQNPKHQFLKIIMVSGKGMLEERLKGYEAGADDYIVKPFDNEELLAKINVFARLKRVEVIENNQSNLLTLLSHETKTPMSGIIGATDLLLCEDLSDSQLELLTMVHDSTHQLLNFIDKISLYYRLTHNYSLQIIRMELLSLMENVLDDLQQDLSNKNIQVVWEHRQDYPLEGDWFLMQTAVKNVVSNAVKYSKEKGEIRIAIHQELNMCNIFISDQGPGISHEDQSSIFEAFSIKDIRHHHKGLGLSLATARLIIESHNGRISLSSEPGHGATFCIQLPIHNPIQSESGAM
ncbi:MAG: hybrid sensor histidine kinase/response regulator [Candidatus Magnetomorum sp.]|nr:hybrid sensor histidine kinase/response regulator [Candidatus Magnetomorum sp.]